jgi:hypothetical protein
MYTFKVHCRDKRTHKNVAVYVKIPENSEALAKLEAEKDGNLKARIAYFAGIANDSKPLYEKSED